MLPIRDPPQNKKLTQAESDGLEENIPCKWTQSKNNWGSKTYIRQNRLSNRNYNKRLKKVTIMV